MAKTPASMAAFACVAALVSTVVDAAPAHAGMYTADTAPACALSDLIGHNWTYIPPSAFDGGVWDNQHECVYQFKSATPGQDAEIKFDAPPQCARSRELQRASAVGKGPHAARVLQRMATSRRWVLH